MKLLPKKQRVQVLKDARTVISNIGSDSLQETNQLMHIMDAVISGYLGAKSTKMKVKPKSAPPKGKIRLENKISMLKSDAIPKTSETPLEYYQH